MLCFPRCPGYRLVGCHLEIYSVRPPFRLPTPQSDLFVHSLVHSISYVCYESLIQFRVVCSSSHHLVDHLHLVVSRSNLIHLHATVSLYICKPEDRSRFTLFTSTLDTLQPEPHPDTDRPIRKTTSMVRQEGLPYACLHWLAG